MPLKFKNTFHWDSGDVIPFALRVRLSFFRTIRTILLYPPYTTYYSRKGGLLSQQYIHIKTYVLMRTYK